MSNQVHIQEFTEDGIIAVRRAIESLRSQKHKTKGSQGTPISSEQVKELKDLAKDKSLVRKSEGAGTVDENKKFSDRMDMARYLSGSVTGKNFSVNIGLWTWLSILYLDQLLAKDKNDNYLLASEYRYIPDESRLRYYRHLVRMAWTIYNQYKEKARLFLSIPCYTHSDFVERSQKTDMLNNPNMIDLFLELFYDEKKSKLKPGIADKADVPGSSTRLVSVVSRQLYMNYDLFEMDSEKIQKILPKEFDQWKKPDEQAGVA